MGRAEVGGLLAICIASIAGCGVTLGYSDEPSLVDQADDPSASNKNGVLDAQVVNPPNDDRDASIDLGNSSDASNDGSITQSQSQPPPGPCAACPSGTAQSMCVSNACVAVRRVFVSSTSSSANLGGASGADARCQNLANAANLGGTWRAWVSTSTSSPNGRFTKATVPYRLLNGTIVANSWNDLTSGSLRHAIDRDEKNAAAAGIEVWTATASNGTLDSGGCNDFTSSSSQSAFVAQGVTDQANTSWTKVYVQYCDRTNPRIYCFEQ